jgi:REP element-mobilizing transposase RayT
VLCQHPELAEVGDLSYNEAMYRHLRRLDRIWPDSPIYFITMCTKNRRSVLARDEASEILIREWDAAHKRHGWAIGRYVIMPDHVHFFAGRS